MQLVLEHTLCTREQELKVLWLIAIFIERIKLDPPPASSSSRLNYTGTRWLLYTKNKERFPCCRDGRSEMLISGNISKRKATLVKEKQHE